MNKVQVQVALRHQHKPRHTEPDRIESGDYP